MGRRFRVGCGSFFLGGWGRGRGLARAILQSRVRRRRAGSNGPMFIVYYIFTQWNFRCCMLQPSRVVPPILDALGSARALFRLRQPVDLGRIEDGEGAVILVPPRTPRRSGYVVYADAVYVVICYMSITCICLLYVVICYMSVICYISVICLVLGTSSGSIGSVWIYRRAIFGKQNW